METVPRFFRGRNDGLPRDLFAGIKIHDDDVGALPVRRRRAPGMNFQGAGLNERDQAVEVLDAEQGLFFSFRIVDEHDVRIDAFPSMLLEELLSLDAVWAAQQRQRAIDDEGRDIAPDVGVVIRQALFGDALVRPIEPIGMGEPHGALLRSRRCRPFNGRRLFADDVARVLIFAQTAKGGVPKILIARPAAKFHLGHQFGAHVAHMARRVRAEPRAKGIRGGVHGIELREKLMRHIRRKSRPNAADMAKDAILVDAEHEGADRPARHRRWRIARDDELLPREAFGLYPTLHAAGAIGRIPQLRHHAFEAEPTGVRQHDRAAVFKVTTQTNLVAGLSAQEFFQQPFAFQQGRAAQIVALEVKKIEDPVDEAIGPPCAQIVLQRGEIRRA